MHSKKEVGEAFREFTEDIGTPNKMVVDQVQQQVAHNSLFLKIANWVCIKLKIIEKGSG